MITLNVIFKYEKVVIFISICGLIMRTDVRKRSSIFNNKIVFIAFCFFLNY